MQIRYLHSWDISYKAAQSLQTELAQQVESKPLPTEPRLIAGMDCAFSSDKTRAICCVVVLSFPELKVVEKKTSVTQITFPYIPGLLTFREGPACIQTVKQLETEPDIFLIDGQGIAHPRRLGLAAHLGLWLNKPTIGCAKSRLVGTFDPPGNEKGQYTELTDKGQKVGVVLRTRSDVKPIFLSIGHLAKLDDAISLTLECCPKYRIPEPTRIADTEVSKFKKDM